MKILVLNGPNLNMLHKRDSKVYGSFSLSEINYMIQNKYKNIDFTFYQSNHEGNLIDMIQESDQYDALIINPAAYTHTSVAIRDALEYIKIIKVEVHLSDIQNREDFRKINYIKDVVDKQIYGKNEKSYFEAVEYILLKQYHSYCHY